MNETYLYCAYDEVMKEWFSPFLADCDSDAYKVWLCTCDVLDDKIEDFSIWCVGTFDVSTGDIKLRSHKTLVGIGGFQ